MYEIVDLHCDLLSYLQKDPKNRTIFDPRVRCSYPQLKQGNVKLQTLAIFSETCFDSLESGQKQLSIFKNMLKEHSDKFCLLNSSFPSAKIALILAFENASAFSSEKEPLEKVLERLTDVQREFGKILYVSMTWNEENRFGGGALTKVGLKEDGKTLLKHLDHLNIAIDFSHTSDFLASDILECIDKYSLKLPVLASHSNFRTLCNHPRNLTDNIAKEIIKRGGVIGLVLYKKFISDHDPYALARHLSHGLNLGGENSVCFGSDYFYVEDFENHPTLAIDKEKMGFFDEYSDASKYPDLLNLLQKELSLTPNELKKISSQNALKFLKKYAGNP